MPPDGRIIAENQASVERFGHLTGPDSVGDIMQRLTLPDGDPLDDQSSPIKEAFRTGEVVSGVELVAHGPHGTRMPVLVSAAPVREDDGPVVAVVAVFRDIAALKEASRLKDEFVSVVSHELRSPLTPIRGFVQLVAKDLAREGGHDPLVSRLSSIAGHVDRMTRLVDDLLDVSRLKSGSLEIRPGTTDLGELCADVIRDRSASVATHRFEFTEPDELVIGDWDADRLYQVIDNLVGNAIKYSPPGGTVTVSAGVDLNDGSAFVTVADDGPGIAASDRDRIFSAFYRTSDAAASQIAGLGLGLYICHELVAAHGGSIEVGGAEGGGAAFTVRLPRITQAVAA
jgi:signal transduction histidine kinase